MSALSRGRGGRRGGGQAIAQYSKPTNGVSSNYGTRSRRGDLQPKASARPSVQSYKPPHRASNQQASSTKGREAKATSKRASAPNQSWRRVENAGNGDYKQRIEEFFQQLRADREQERANAIRNGLLADPNKRTRLEDAITVVGTCQDMCPEFERIQRIREQAVERPEKVTLASGAKVPSEDLMVKCFHRSDAGKDEQLPSDLRPPKILQRTLNYLLDDILGGPEPLADVHKFLWDRTRAIRNDFSIQQVTKAEDLKIAIDCFERIARFHLLSLHQLTHPRRANGDFVPQQEREQLSNTLVSLMYYYDDCRSKFEPPNEAEFRAYSIILEIRARSHDLKPRVQNLPQRVVMDPKVQSAMRLQTASGKMRNVENLLSHYQRSSTVGKGDYASFWSIVRSTSTTYLMGCAAEAAFNFVRQRALETMERSFRVGGAFRPKFEDFTLDDLMEALGFDDDEQTQKFLEDVGFEFKERDDGDLYLDIDKIGTFPTDTISRHEQIFSETLVEPKRKHRAFKAVINGLSVQRAKQEGLIEDKSDGESEESLFVSSASGSPERDASPSAAQVAKDAKPLANSNPFLNMKSTTTDPFVSAKEKLPQGFFRAPVTSAGFGNIQESSTSTPSQGPNSTHKPFSAFQNPPMSNEQIAQTVFGGSLPKTTPSMESPNMIEEKKGLKSIFDSVPQGSPFTNRNASEGLSSPFDAIRKESPFSRPPNDSSTQKGPAASTGDSASGTEAGKSLFDRITKSDAASGTSGSERPDASQDKKGFTPTSWPTNLQAESSSGSPQGFKAPAFGQQPPLASGSAQPSPFINPGSTPSLPNFAVDSQKPSSPFVAGQLPASQSGFNFASALGAQPSTSVSRQDSQSPVSPLTKTSPEKSRPTWDFKQPSKVQAPSVTSSFNSSASRSPQPGYFAQSSGAETRGVTQRASVQQSTQTDAESSKHHSKHISGASKPAFLPDHKLFTPQTSLNESGASPFETTIPSSLPASTGASASFDNSSSSAQQSFPLASSGVFDSTSAAEKQRQEDDLKRKAQVQSETIDKLTKELVCGDYGLIEQMTEHLMEGIFDDCVRIVRKERQQKKNDQLRGTYLSKKYLALWRERSWKLRLKRKAVQRRKTMSKSIRDLTRNAGESRRTSVASDGTELSNSVNGNISIPLGSLLTAPHFHHVGEAAKSSRLNKRKELHDDKLPDKEGMTNGTTPSTEKSYVFKKPKISNISHHRRTQTMGLSLPSFPSVKESVGSESFRASMGQVRKSLSGSDSIFSESVLKRARQVIGKTDTTHTDYFRLKARGIDPNTSIIPETRKRSRASTESFTDSPTPETTAKATKQSPPTLASLSPQTRELLSHSQDSSLASSLLATNTAGPSDSSSRSTSNLNYTPEEDALFAQARQLRETLAEEEAWFRREREAFEAKQKVKDPPANETEKQKQLREWKGTPSKTSTRLEKTRAGGLLPEGWNKSSPGLSVNGTLSKGKGKERAVDSCDEPDSPLAQRGTQKGKGSMASFGSPQQQGQQQLRGFAALANGTNFKLGPGKSFGPAMGSGDLQQQQQQQQQQHAFGRPSSLASKGGSAEDAIEL